MKVQILLAFVALAGCNSESSPPDATGSKKTNAQASAKVIDNPAPDLEAAAYASFRLGSRFEASDSPFAIGKRTFAVGRSLGSERAQGLYASIARLALFGDKPRF